MDTHTHTIHAVDSELTDGGERRRCDRARVSRADRPGNRRRREVDTIIAFSAVPSTAVSIKRISHIELSYRGNWPVQQQVRCLAEQRKKKGSDAVVYNTAVRGYTRGQLGSKTCSTLFCRYRLNLSTYSIAANIVFIISGALSMQKSIWHGQTFHF